MGTFGIGLLVPILLFFGLTVVWGGAISQMAVKNIEGQRNPD